jgi:hypothetical protein
MSHRPLTNSSSLKITAAYWPMSITSLLLAAAYTILPFFCYLFYAVAPLPESYESWPMAIASLLLAEAYYILLVIYSMLVPHYVNPMKADQWPSQPAAGCSFYNSTCYLLYTVAPLPESYESWPMAIASLLLAEAYSILLVIYSMLVPHYVNPMKADQWPSQPAAGCCFSNSTCYLFYAVAPSPESYESWPMAITA